MTTAAAAPAGIPARRPGSRARPNMLDIGLGAFVGVSLLWSMTLAAGLDSPAGLPLEAFVAHVAVLVGTTLWRVAPRSGLIIAMLGMSGYHGLGGVPVGLAWPLVLQSYAVARRGHLALGIAAGPVYILGMTGYRVAIAGGAPSLVEAQVTIHVVLQAGVLLAAALLLGEVVRSRAMLAAETKERMTLLERRHEQATERRIAEERLRIAHDLHDVAAHTVSVIGLHANVATERFQQDPAQARDALETIRTTSERAARELRAVVGLLRDPDVEPPAAPIDAIRDTVRRARSTGLNVDLHLDVEDGELQGAPGVAVARIVQESLTNVLRHADASQARVAVRDDGDVIRVEVVDNGRGPVDPGRIREHGGGVGLLGMRERAETLGGTASWGGVPVGGFRVYAELPSAGAR